MHKRQYTKIVFNTQVISFSLACTYRYLGAERSGVALIWEFSAAVGWAVVFHRDLHGCALQ